MPSYVCVCVCRWLLLQADLLGQLHYSLACNPICICCQTSKWLLVFARGLFSDVYHASHARVKHCVCCYRQELKNSIRNSRTQSKLHYGACRSSSVSQRRTSQATPGLCVVSGQPVSVQSVLCLPQHRQPSRLTACLRALTSTPASPGHDLRSSAWTCSASAWTQWRRFSG